MMIFMMTLVSLTVVAGVLGNIIFVHIRSYVADTALLDPLVVFTWWVVGGPLMS